MTTEEAEKIALAAAEELEAIVGELRGWVSEGVTQCPTIGTKLLPINDCDIFTTAALADLYKIRCTRCRSLSLQWDGHAAVCNLCLAEEKTQ